MALTPARRLDVRAIPTWDRHSRIFDAFAALESDAELVLVTDHEPRALRLQFERRYPEGFVWEQRQVGTGRWEVNLRHSPGVDGGGRPAFLRRCALLQDASSETLRHFEQLANESTYERGQTIVEQDAQWPYLGFLKAGWLSLTASSQTGREQHLFDILPCDSFGEIETVDGGRTIARLIVTSETASIVMIPRGIVISAMIADSMLARKIAGACAQRARRLAARFSAYVSHSAVARVAAALLPFASPDAGLSPALEPLRQLTQNQLASVAGTAKEVAARAIADLETAGALQRARGHISHIDRAKLQRFIPEE